MTWRPFSSVGSLALLALSGTACAVGGGHSGAAPMTHVIDLSHQLTTFEASPSSAGGELPGRRRRLGQDLCELRPLIPSAALPHPRDAAAESQRIRDTG